MRAAYRRGQRQARAGGHGVPVEVADRGLAGLHRGPDRVLDRGVLGVQPDHALQVVGVVPVDIGLHGLLHGLFGHPNMLR